MKHFEISYRIGNHSFVYKCSTAYEALEALASIRQHDTACYIDLDDYMEVLLKMKNGKTLTYDTYRIHIAYLDGEV